MTCPCGLPPLCACGHARELHDVTGRCLATSCLCSRWHPSEREVDIGEAHSVELRAVSAAARDVVAAVLVPLDVLEHLLASSCPLPGREGEHNEARGVVLRAMGRPV